MVHGGGQVPFGSQNHHAPVRGYGGIVATNCVTDGRWAWTEGGYSNHTGEGIAWGVVSRSCVTY